MKKIDKDGLLLCELQATAFENSIDKKTEEFYQNHLDRIQRGECNDEACIIFSEMLTDFERIGDHTWNVAKQMAKIIERGK